MYTFITFEGWIVRNTIKNDNESSYSPTKLEKYNEFILKVQEQVKHYQKCTLLHVFKLSYLNLIFSNVQCT